MSERGLILGGGIAAAVAGLYLYENYAGDGGKDSGVGADTTACRDYVRRHKEAEKRNFGQSFLYGLTHPIDSIEMLTTDGETICDTGDKNSGSCCPPSKPSKEWLAEQAHEHMRHVKSKAAAKKIKDNEADIIAELNNADWPLIPRQSGQPTSTDQLSRTFIFDEDLPLMTNPRTGTTGTYATLYNEVLQISRGSIDGKFDFVLNKHDAAALRARLKAWNSCGWNMPDAEWRESMDYLKVSPNKRPLIDLRKTTSLTMPTQMRSVDSGSVYDFNTLECLKNVPPINPHTADRYATTYTKDIGLQKAYRKQIWDRAVKKNKDRDAKLVDAAFNKILALVQAAVGKKTSRTDLHTQYRTIYVDVATKIDSDNSAMLGKISESWFTSVLDKDFPVPPPPKAHYKKFDAKSFDPFKLAREEAALDKKLTTGRDEQIKKDIKFFEGGYQGYVSTLTHANMPHLSEEDYKKKITSLFSTQ